MATPNYRRISSCEEIKLKRCLRKIKSNLNLEDGGLMDCLVEEGFDIDDKNAILKEPHRLKQIDLLITKLMFRADGYKIFVQSLTTSGHGFLADSLEADEEALNKSTQTSPHPCYKDLEFSVPNSLGVSTVNNRNELALDFADGPKPIPSQAKGSSQQQRTIPTFYLSAPEASPSKDDRSISEVTSETSHISEEFSSSNASRSSIYENAVGETCRDVGTEMDDDYDDAISLWSSIETPSLAHSGSALEESEVCDQPEVDHTRRDLYPPGVDHVPEVFSPPVVDHAPGVLYPPEDDHAPEVFSPPDLEVHHAPEVFYPPEAYNTCTFEEGKGTGDELVSLQYPARLTGFSGKNLDMNSIKEFSSLFEEEGWYAGVNDINIKHAITQARSQHGGYIVWYSYKSAAVVVTLIDKNSVKGRIHFKMLTRHFENSTLYSFDQRVHCRTPRETLNAAKKKGLLIKAEKISNYYKQ